jgi:predicted TIM-barrel fold metal-dependent hydrolase
MSKLDNSVTKLEASQMKVIQDAKPHFVSVEKRIEDLDKYSFDSQVTMMQPNLDPTNLALSSEEELRLSKLANDELASLSDSSRGRMYAVGVVPLDINEGDYLEEMRRAIRDLGLKGFMVMTNRKGKPIDQYEALWSEAERLGAVIYLHPVDAYSFQGRTYEGQYDLAHVFGWPFETTLILSRLIFTGLLTKYPSLKVIAHHLGGMIPFFSGRIEDAYSERTSSAKTAHEKADLRRKLSKPVWEYYKEFYYDTSVGSTAAIRCGYDNFGSKKIVFSTDYPWGEDAGRARLEAFPKMIHQLNLSQNEEAEIFGDNIRKLVGI